MKTLTCCCCGEAAPAMEQWHNRDNGFGLCGKCAVWIKSRGMSDSEFRELYGEEGRHWFGLLNPAPVEVRTVEDADAHEEQREVSQFGSVIVKRA